MKTTHGRMRWYCYQGDHEKKPSGKLLAVVYMDDEESYSCYSFLNGRPSRLRFCETLEDARLMFLRHLMEKRKKAEMHVWTLFPLQKKDALNKRTCG